jgi:Kef-type K+ transport system membrane component KefB
MRLVLLLVLAGLMEATRSFSPEPLLGGSAGGITLACGFLLLTGFLAGSLFKDIGLPRLTGYLLTGLAVGPYAFELVSHEMILKLRLFNGIAIALIALTAGSEIEFRAMRDLFPVIRRITVLAVVGGMGVLAGAIFLMRGYLPFFEPLTVMQAAAIATTLGVVISAQSPAVVVALRDELRSEGPLTRTVLGVVVLADLVVILAFAVVSALAQAVFGGDTDIAVTAQTVSWEILGSLGAGVLIGVMMSLLMRMVSGEGGLFVVVLGFTVAEVGQRVDLDPLLIALASGLYIRNVTNYGDRLQAAVESASLPVYVAFFAVAGATIHLDALQAVLLPALILVVVRAGAFLGGARLATKLSGSPEHVQRYAGFGLLPQAGLALALALLFSRAFPDLGDDAAALVFGIVAINEIVSPVLFRIALARSGEAGRKASFQPEHPSSASGERAALPAEAP